MFNTTDPTKPIKKVGEPIGTPITPQPTTAAPWAPTIGQKFSANTATGDRQIIFNDAASGRTIVRDPRTGKYTLYPYRRVQAALEGKYELRGGQPMDTYQANYFMDASKSQPHYRPKTAGDNTGQEAKAVEYRKNRQPGSYHADGTPAMILKRKGGIFYGTKEI